MKFGKPMLQHWLLETDCIFLNHGSFGATPKVVLAAQTEWRSRMERQPVHFMTKELPHQLRLAASELGKLIGARGEDLVFVDNATAGINAVVRSLSLDHADQIVTTNHVYGAVHKTLSFVCQTTGAQLVTAPVPFPLHDVSEAIASVASALNPSVKLLVIDHVTSPTALILPVAELIRVAKAQGIPVLIDGAHAPGMLPLNLQELGADWYVGNCHKWLCAPKGCGFLYANPAAQTNLHPVVISHGLGLGYLAEFDWTGTRDFSAWLAVTEAIAFQQQIGIENIQIHNHELATQAAQILATAWQQELPAPLNMLGAMATIPLPYQFAANDLLQAAANLHDILWERYRIEVPIIPFSDRLWIRISAQIYNELQDYKYLAKAISSLLDIA